MINMSLRKVKLTHLKGVAAAAEMRHIHFGRLLVIIIRGRNSADSCQFICSCKYRWAKKNVTQ